MNVFSSLECFFPKRRFFSENYLPGVASANANSFTEDELLRVFRAMTPERQRLFIEQGKVFVKANRISREKVKSS